MQTSVNPTPAPATTQGYAGLYLRNNLSCTGVLPATGPFAQCPDIVGSATVLLQPNTLATPPSWHQLYEVQPTPGSPYYYYLRSRCGGTGAATAQASLYYAPANLLLHPALWQNNGLTTSAGGNAVHLAAAAGAIAVGPEPFEWPAEAVAAGLYSFVGQVTSNDVPNPIPTITSWADMSALFQDLGFGFRTTCHFDATNFNWTQALGFSVPAEIETPGELTFTVTTQGLSGCTITVASPVLLPSGRALQYGPQPISGDTFQGSIQDVMPTGYSTLLNVSIFNPTGQAVASGSSLTLTVSYLETSTQDSSQAIGIQPTPMVLLGQATFVAA